VHLRLEVLFDLVMKIKGNELFIKNKGAKPKTKGVSRKVSIIKRFRSQQLAQN